MKSLEFRGTNYLTFLRLLPPLLLLLLLFYKQKKKVIIKKIYDAVVNAGYSERLARFIVSQSAHETAAWTSVIYRLNHNLFGMKLPKRRKTTATGEKRGHAIYSSSEQSIEDYILYLRSQSYPLDCVSIGEFVNVLVKKGYFEAPISEYREGLERHYKKIFTNG